ncbi:MAG: lasso RiPP family leader peptide-containing protein [bacterium]
MDEQHLPEPSIESTPDSLDGREAYESPELMDRGDVSELTQTGASNPGADAGYS